MAVIIAVPAPTPVAEVFEFAAELPVKTVAILVLELIQITCEVMSDMEPSENIPTATKGSDAPTFKLRGEAAGSIIIAANIFTMIFTGWLVNPARLAVMFAVPPPAAVAIPPEATFTTVELELEHTT